jgi:hypothetical protein
MVTTSQPLIGKCITTSSWVMVIKEAQKKERSNDHGGKAMIESREEALSFKTQPTVAEMRQWLQDRKQETDKKTKKPKYLAKQLELMEVVVERACVERNDTQAAATPLLWCLHGGPGVGKSHVLKLVKEFFEFLGYRSNVEYVMTALQAIMAEQLDGDTLHHALGITPAQFKKAGASAEGAASKRAKEVSTFLEQCRWLVIDEVSMISVVAWTRHARESSSMGNCC